MTYSISLLLSILYDGSGLPPGQKGYTSSTLYSPQKPQVGVFDYSFIGDKVGPSSPVHPAALTYMAEKRPLQTSRLLVNRPILFNGALLKVFKPCQIYFASLKALLSPPSY